MICEPRSGGGTVRFADALPFGHGGTGSSGRKQVDDSEQANPERRQPRSHTRRTIGCVLLPLLALVLIAVLLWINSERVRKPDRNVNAPVQGPVEPVPARPPA